MTEQKFCKDCKWLSPFGGCYSPNLPVELVYGTRTLTDPSRCRGNEDECGVEAKWFEQRAEVVKPVVVKPVPTEYTTHTKEISYWQKLKTYFQ